MDFKRSTASGLFICFSCTAMYVCRACGAARCYSTLHEASIHCQSVPTSSRPAQRQSLAHAHEARGGGSCFRFFDVFVIANVIITVGPFACWPFEASSALRKRLITKRTKQKRGSSLLISKRAATSGRTINGCFQSIS
jgi:hypothetical protein